MIPAMTDPLGRHWQQPQDIREAPMDDLLVLLTPAQFEGLSEYSTSMPSGVYPGKCWRRNLFTRDPQTGNVVATDKWLLGWYGESTKGPGWCSNNWRAIEVVA